MRIISLIFCTWGGGKEFRFGASESCISVTISKSVLERQQCQVSFVINHFCLEERPSNRVEYWHREKRCLSDHTMKLRCFVSGNTCTLFAATMKKHNKYEKNDFSQDGAMILFFSSTICNIYLSIYLSIFEGGLRVEKDRDWNVRMMTSYLQLMTLFYWWNTSPATPMEEFCGSQGVYVEK